MRSDENFLKFCRLEQSVSNVEKTREFSCNKYRNFRIPCEWMFESGLVGQVI